VLDVTDYLEALVDDPATAVIAAYLEGCRDGTRLANALARARSAGKPVVVLKAGRTAAAAAAAAAHTGALAGDDRVWSAVFDEHAVVAVRSQRELIDACLYLSSIKGKLPGGNGVAISTFGGGVGVLSADLCAQHGLATPPLGESTRARLASLVPPFASTANPVDHTPATFSSPWIERFPEALDAISADPAIAAMFFPLSAMATGAAEVGAALAELSTRSDKPICVSWMFAPPAGPAALARARIHAFAEPARALEALGHAAGYAQAIRRPDAANADVAPKAFDWKRHVPSPVAGQVITEDACHRLLADAGLPVARARLARDEDDAVRAAHEAGPLVAMKGIAISVTHRAAAGLLALDLSNDDEVRDAWRRLASRARDIGVQLEGAYVQQMASGRLEILVSALRDPVFGVIVACGAGGNLTEVIDDVALARAPFGVARAAQVLGRLRIVQRASRVDPEVRLEPLATFVSEFSRLVAGAPWRRFVVEINPVKWRANDVVAVDGLIIIEAP
jgi:acetyltransferase